MTVPIIQTERLTLRPFRTEDAQDVFEACSNPVLGTNAGWPPHTTIEDSLEYINVIAPMGHVWAITEAGCDRVIGSIGLLGDPRMPEDGSVMMLGYWLAEDKWNRGYTTEASKAVITWGFTEGGYAKITTCHFLFNHASRRVIEKCGFVPTAVELWPSEDESESEQDAQWYELVNATRESLP